VGGLRLYRGGLALASDLSDGFW